MRRTPDIPLAGALDREARTNILNTNRVGREWSLPRSRSLGGRQMSSRLIRRTTRLRPPPFACAHARRLLLPHTQSPIDRIPRSNARPHTPQRSQLLSCRGRMHRDSVKCRYRHVTASDSRSASTLDPFQLTFEDLVTRSSRKRTANSEVIDAVYPAAMPLYGKNCVPHPPWFRIITWSGARKFRLGTRSRERVCGFTYAQCQHPLVPGTTRIAWPPMP